MKRFSVFTLLCVSLAFLFAVGAGGVANAHSTKLGVPHAESPANGALLTNLPRTVTLAWFPVAEAASFTVTLGYNATSHKGPFTTVSTFTTGTDIPATTFTLQLTETDLANDGFYQWQVTANPTTGTTESQSAPQVFQFVTTKILDIPAQQAPPDKANLYTNTGSLAVTLEWDCRVGVANAALDGYNVYIEMETGSNTWTAVTGSPFAVQTATGGDTFQNSSYTYTFGAAGTYRWAVQSLGGNGANDSPVPSDSNSKLWFEININAATE